MFSNIKMLFLILYLLIGCVYVIHFSIRFIKMNNKHKWQKLNIFEVLFYNLGFLKTILSVCIWPYYLWYDVKYNPIKMLDNIYSEMEELSEL